MPQAGHEPTDLTILAFPESHREAGPRLLAAAVHPADQPHVCEGCATRRSSPRVPPSYEEQTFLQLQAQANAKVAAQAARVLEADLDRGLTSGGANASLVTAPVSAVQPEDLRPADEIRGELGLDPDRPAVLMQLGAGQVNDTGSLSSRVVASLQRHPEVQVVVTESVLTREPAVLPEDVTRLRHFPIGEHRAAFDASVMAAGYNSFQEAMALGLPTLFIPNMSTAKDDQDLSLIHI